MGFVEEIDTDVVMADDELVTDSDEMGFGFSEEEDERENITTLQPKLSFKDRANAFVGPKDETFLKIENYFFGLLNTPKLSINDILEGTFDNHEIGLITPQSGPPDIVRFQLRNTQRYRENLETRFNGHAETLAFKMACLYFGFPVEPIRTGTMSFPSAPDPDPLEEKVVRNPDPLQFLEKYDAEIKPVYNENVLGLRGGGDYKPYGYAAVSPVGNISLWDIPAYKKEEQDMQEIKLEDYDDWDVINQSVSSTKVKVPQFRLYGWQGAIDSRLKYTEFVSQIDKLISNWDKIDRGIFVEIWQRSPVKFVESVRGVTSHRFTSDPVGDKIWDFVQKYFGKGDTEKYACFVRTAGEGAENRPTGYEPVTEDNHVVRILNKVNNDVAYMRVSKVLHAEHRPHQFSMEYMRAMQVLLLPGPPHAWVSYEHSLFGETYQYLDPPGGLFEQIIVARNFNTPTTVSFELKAIDKDGFEFVPIIIPGVFKAEGVPLMVRKEFGSAKGLSKVYKATKVCLKKVNVKSECNGFDIWCQGPDFKYLHEKPTHIAFPGNITNAKSQEDWQRLVDKAPDTGPICLVVRPVYKEYRLQKPGPGNEKVSLQLNELDLQSVKTFVHNRLYKNYDPKNSSQVILLKPVSQESWQPELTIQSTTTEEDWQWMRRNIVEPEFHVIVENLGNHWEIPEDLPPWGPRYVVEAGLAGIPKETSGTSHLLFQKFSGDDSQPSEDIKAEIKSSPATTWTSSISSVHLKTTSPIMAKKMYKGYITPPSSTTTPQKKKETKIDVNNKVLETVFKASKNTVSEAERVRILRNRSFATAASIFTNPLKPVMPLEGPPLESLIKTGPAMPGVSIAMMTPTEVLRLQREVHSLRAQLLNRTRECPYADCERYFKFADGAGLDRHVREDHNVLRCFLCDKDKYLLPYYNTDQIKEHFVKYHVNDILKAYGAGGTKVSASKKAPVTQLSASSDEDETSEEEDVPQKKGLPKWKGSKKQQKPKQQIASSSDSSETSESSESSDESDSSDSSESSDSSDSDSDSISPPPPVKVKESSPPPLAKHWANMTKLIAEGKSPWPEYVPLPPLTGPPDPSQIPPPVKHKKSGLQYILEKIEPDEPPVKAPEKKTTPEKSAIQKGDDPGPQISIEKKSVVPGGKKAEIFTAVNPNPDETQVQGAWVKAILEKYLYDEPQKVEAKTPGFNIFTTVNKEPGTTQDNEKFIRRALEEYEKQGGELPLKDHGAKWGKILAKQGFAGGLLAQVDADGDKPKKKRKRPAGLDFESSDSGSELYEYSERSAVPDPLANLTADAPPSPVRKKQRKTKKLVPPPPTPVDPLSSPSESSSDER
ncbi:hypothetical protein E0Z10_g1229 [Xylaria hypoxylon]|uniref:Uncharacterized protein n=1 Tax=Xylaria hypoxylon TaxID=37992 RepID=A0A4Z0ZD49_9PEZI|nr:hypothetical protein E0Z10_g1229 [Xylaria hypoxylon]